MSPAMIRTYRYQIGHGAWAKFDNVQVRCQSQRGKFYASMDTLNASSTGVGDTPEAAFADWERQHGAVLVKTSA